MQGLGQGLGRGLLRDCRLEDHFFLIARVDCHGHMLPVPVSGTLQMLYCANIGHINVIPVGIHNCGGSWMQLLVLQHHGLNIISLIKYRYRYCKHFR